MRTSHIAIRPREIRCMRRRAIKLIQWLLLGAVVNIAVAWACTIAANPDVLGQQSVAVDDDIPGWPAGAPSQWPPPHYSELGWSFGFEIESFMVDDLNPAENWRPDWQCWRALRTDAGWPLRSMRSIWFEQRVSEQVCETSGFLRGGMTIHSNNLKASWASKRFGRMPLWPGFAINTLIYAAALWMLFAGPFALRRANRRRRGRCVVCGYDLRGRGRGQEHAKCPECGTEVTPSIEQ